MSERSSSVEVATFGCRLNVVESEAIRRMVPDGADLIIVNTCAVTSEAVRQSRQAIRRLARERPGVRIVVTGCAAQTHSATYADMPEVTAVVGNLEKRRPGVWQDAVADALPQRLQVGDFSVSAESIGPFEIATATENRTRAFLEIQNGCDHRCTFCIIPYGRGPSRSAPLAAIVEKARALADTGRRELVLTGVDLTSWGNDLPGAPRLGRLVREILRQVPHFDRLRLSSLDCIEVDEELADAIAGEPRLMPHLHLSLQAGDDLILKRMKRRHSRQQAIDFCDRIRRLRPEIVFGADIIAGFPTETEAMFARSLDLIEDCGLTHLHVFPYSAREGTPAARMPPLAGDIVKERAARLRNAGAAALARHLERQAGRRLEVLTERGGHARSQDFTLVHTPGLEAGLITEVTITGHDGRALLTQPPVAAPRA